MAHTIVTVDEAIQKALDIYNAHNTAYSMAKRMQHGLNNYPKYYDCSSFVGTCWGFTSCPGTAGMASAYAASGFDVYAFNDMAPYVQRGDIIVWQAYDPASYGANGHTMIYLGSGYPGAVIHCTSSGTPNGYKGGVQFRSSIYPSNKINRARSYIIRGTSGIFITSIIDNITGKPVYSRY